MIDFLLQIGILDEIKQYGGYVGYLCIIAVIVLWNKLTSKDAQIQRLTGQMAKAAIEDMKVNTAMSGFIERLVDEMPVSEKRVTDTIRAEAEATRELLLQHKEYVRETLRQASHPDRAATA